MLSKHGTLEGAIMSTLWELEKDGIYTNSVKDVYNILAKNDAEKRAYTTIKTVMDRLHDKKILLRYKQGRKFFYRSAYSNDEVIINALSEMANRYCGGDLQKLAKVINIMLNDKELISA
jgi:predicted transcriptional regulator